MADLVKQLREADFSRENYPLFDEAADEIGRLRNVIDCGCSAIWDAVAVGDRKHIRARLRRMCREMTVRNKNEDENTAD